MNFLIVLAAAAAFLAAPSDSIPSGTVLDATPLVRPEYRNLARRLTLSPATVPTAGNDLEVIHTGTRYAELLMGDLKDARDLVEIEVFLYGQDPDGMRVRDTLFGLIDRGVEVRYIHDNFGNFFDNVFDGRRVFTGYYDNLAKGGIVKREFSPLLCPDYTFTDPSWRNHRKINLIDRRVAFVGGMNITEGSMSGWGDTQVRITGPAVRSVAAVFQSDWDACSPRRPDGPPAALEVAGSCEGSSGRIVQLVPDGHDCPAYMMEETLVWLLDHARRYIWFETPYFIPNRPLMNALKRAAARGLDVRVIVPETTDMSAFDPAYRAPVKECVKNGITIVYRKPPFNHSKTFVCDDYITCVGSSNLDKLCLQCLNEINVLIYDAPTALAQREYLEEQMKETWVADQAFVDSWDSTEKFKQALMGLVNHWL